MHRKEKKKKTLSTFLIQYINIHKVIVPLSLNFFNVGPTSKMEAAFRWGIFSIAFSPLPNAAPKHN